jgi:hypothetical protein
MPCNLNSQCAASFCNIPGGQSSGTCGSLLSNGSACSVDSQCQSNFCYNGSCSSKLSFGQVCYTNSQCQSGNCVYFAGTGTCH